MPRVSPFLHRNSQKRIYVRGATYFITSVTHQRYPYFNEKVLADLVVYDLWLSEHLKDYRMVGYTVLPDHVHIMFQPQGERNYSEILQNIKRVFSLQANQIMFWEENPAVAGEDIYPHLQLPTNEQDPYGGLRWSGPLREFRKRIVKKYGANHHLPKFKWQSSFRDHIIRDRRDFDNHLQYIYNNAAKHGLVEEPEQWRWMWVEGMDQPL